MNSGEGTPQHDVEVSIPTIERFNVVQQNWDTVVEKMKALNSAKRFDPTELADAARTYAESSEDYFTSLLESMGDESDEAKIELLASAYTSLDSQRVETINDIFTDLSNPPQQLKQETARADMSEIFDDSDSDEEIIEMIHDGFVRDVESDVEKITSSGSLIRRVEKEQTRHNQLQNLQDVAKIAVGTAIGFIVAQKLFGRKD